jgi:predicted RNase H-like HicB family nuclease
MQTQVLNYRVIIEPEEYPNGDKVYNAYCPTLAVSDYGDSVEEVMESIKDGISLAIECL